MLLNSSKRKSGKSFNIYVLGDSHVREWAYIRDNNLSKMLNIIGINKRPGKTATWLDKPENMELMLNPIINKKTKQLDYCLVYIGEVDCNCALWLRYGYKHSNLIEGINAATDNLITLGKALPGQIVFMGPILPLLTTHKNIKYIYEFLRLRTKVHANQRQRTWLTQQFCNILSNKAAANKFLYVDIHDKMLDPKTGLTKLNIIRKHAYWHHLHTSYGAKLWLPRIERVIKNHHAST